MYLRYDEKTGLVGNAYNVAVPEPFIVITDTQNEQIQSGVWFVKDNKLTQEPTDAYIAFKRIQEIEEELKQCDIEYQQALQTPIEFENHLYKPVWIDDGTYSKLITGALSQVLEFPQPIFDSTEKQENMVMMDQVTFMSLVKQLANKQAELFLHRKQKRSLLIEEREQLQQLNQ